jgi:hypothetical protein
MRVRSFGYVLSALVSAGLVAGLSVPASAHAAGSGWRIDPSASPGVRSHLHSVSCTGARCTAVGDYRSRDVVRTLAERWAGSRWRHVASPNPARTRSSTLQSVSCAASNRCMAVGAYRPASTRARKALVERWNGSSWRIIPGPSTGKNASTSLSTVSCPRAGFCAAVGFFYVGPRDQPRRWGALFAVWNGRRWRVVNRDSTGGYDALSCASARACTAIGSGGNKLALLRVARWDGRSVRFSYGPRDDFSPDFTSWNGISCSVRYRCVIVGYFEDVYTRSTPVARRWNGTGWTPVNPPPYPTGQYTSSGLTSVSCTTQQHCVAVGTHETVHGPPYGQLPFVEVLRGSSWHIVASQRPKGTLDAFLATVSCQANHPCRAVGSYLVPGTPRGTYRTLTEHG